jgi:hypothetical protein
MFLFFVAPAYYLNCSCSGGTHICLAYRGVLHEVDAKLPPRNISIYTGPVPSIVSEPHVYQIWSTRSFPPFELNRACQNTWSWSTSLGARLGVVLSAPGCSSFMSCYMLARPCLFGMGHQCTLRQSADPCSDQDSQLCSCAIGRHEWASVEEVKVLIYVSLCSRVYGYCDGIWLVNEFFSFRVLKCLTFS